MASIDFILYQEAAGPDNAQVCLYVDGQRVLENATVTSTDSMNPDTFTVSVDLTNGEHTLGVEFMNDYYVGGNDRNIIWAGTTLDGAGMRWRTMSFDGITHTADIDTPGTEGWFPFNINYTAIASFSFTAPYNWSAV